MRYVYHIQSAHNGRVILYALHTFFFLSYPCHTINIHNAVVSPVPCFPFPISCSPQKAPPFPVSRLLFPSKGTPVSRSRFPVSSKGTPVSRSRFPVPLKRHPRFPFPISCSPQKAPHSQFPRTSSTKTYL